MSATNKPPHVVVGTAGHIDHGKSTLVKALTGIDPDRLIEEKQRGITIDLGFAFADIEGTRFSFVDVPGHERFVHNMLAGVFGIDMVMLVVAADESVMPQTREHLAICRLLGLHSGVVALTRIDLAEAGMPDLVEEELEELVAGTFLETAPIVRVSGVTGEGLDALRRALAHAAEAVVERALGPWPRLPVDRVFAAKGFGTVVTGTLQGGQLAIGDLLSAIPGEARGRVRGLQVHGQTVERAEPHRRVAVNLQGIDREQLARGMVLVPVGHEVTTRVLDALLEIVEDAPVALEHGQRVRVHHGTAEVMGRLRLPASLEFGPRSSGAAQIRLEAPLAALPGDRVVVRRYSPITTLGGGVIADIDPPRWRRSDRQWPERTRRWASASRYERLALAVSEAGRRGVSLSEQAMTLGLDAEDVRKRIAAEDAAGDALSDLVGLGRDRIYDGGSLEELFDAIEQRTAAFHRKHPLDPGPSPDRLRGEIAAVVSLEAFRDALDRGAAAGRWIAGREAVRLAGHEAAPEGAEADKLERLLAALEPAGLEALATQELQAEARVGDEAEKLLSYAARRRQAIRLGDGRWVSGAAWTRLVERLRERARAGSELIDVGTFKELFGLTRKYAIPLLERLDNDGVTQRIGNQRRIRRPDVDSQRG
ncbi:MAG: selenocysteine-specific translation elongation factor [Acidobacteriota bacterium]|nr:MAG: selenocysteine-specific translation elongation factor [Acidobacteriota bacterium]